MNAIDRPSVLLRPVGNPRSLIRNLREAVLAALLVAATCLAAGCGSPYEGPRSPEQTVASFQIRDAFEVEIFAAEPRVVDPVAVAFDARGRLYAAEMRDYPFRPDSGEARSRVRLLEDTDADGRADRSTIFADSLVEVTSIQPWKGGILVTAAPNILYLEDTDGDRRADVRRTVFTGFFTGNSEAQITDLRFDLTNWIYASNAGRTGSVRFLEHPDAPPVTVNGGDFRFRLDRGAFERVSGSAQFGQDVDDFGRRFVTQNTRHVRHVVLPETYATRNPAADLPVLENVNDHGLRMYQRTETPHWREVRTRRRNRRYEREGLDRTEYARDHFTGASGGTIYSAALFPEPYRGNLFTAEVAGNLVHRDLLTPRGATFLARRAPDEQDREFLSSTDPWFRPTSLEVGPDGALYLIDMYRQHVESPFSIPEDLKEEMDFSAGDDRGRIYRIAPREAPSGASHDADSEENDDQSGRSGGDPAFEYPPNLKAASSAELVELLAHRNRWWRLTAQRLLVERQDTEVVEKLRSMSTGHPRPRARLHALYALEGLSALRPQDVASRLDDPHPGVREHAVRLAERYDELVDDLAARTDDPSSRVAFRLALSLGAHSGSTALEGLADLATHRTRHEWIRTALLTSRPGSSVRLLERCREHGFFDLPAEGRLHYARRVSEVIGRRAEKEQVDRLVRLAGDLDGEHRGRWQRAILEGLSEGLRTHEDPPPVDSDALGPLIDASAPAVREAARRLRE